jgi:hypothetical protein
MRNVVICAGLFAIVAVAGCGGGSVEHEHEYYDSPDYSGERTMTRIHVQSHDDPSTGYRVIEGQPIHVHIHAENGRSICIEISTGRE